MRKEGEEEGSLMVTTLEGDGEGHMSTLGKPKFKTKFNSSFID